MTRVLMTDLRNGGVSVHIVGETPDDVQKEITRMMRQADDENCFISFQNPFRHDGTWTANGVYVPLA